MMVRRLGSLLVVVGLILAAWPALTWAYGFYWQQRLSRSFPEPVFSERVTEEAAPAPGRGVVAVSASLSAPSGPRLRPRIAPPKPTKPPEPLRVVARPGEAFARLRIRRIGLDAMVVEGVDGAALRRGPGHLRDTGLPGESRNCAIAAHRDGWFRRLPELRAGDPVLVERPGALYRYVVQNKRVVTPDRSDLLRRGPKPVLTLITCTGPGYPRSAYRLLVFCRLQGVLHTR